VDEELPRTGKSIRRTARCCYEDATSGLSFFPVILPPYSVVFCYPQISFLFYSILSAFSFLSRQKKNKVDAGVGRQASKFRIALTKIFTHAKRPLSQNKPELITKQTNKTKILQIQKLQPTSFPSFFSCGVFHVRSIFIMCFVLLCIFPFDPGSTPTSPNEESNRVSYLRVFLLSPLLSTLLYLYYNFYTILFFA
jgi:hypothetical protein